MPLTGNDKTMFDLYYNKAKEAQSDTQLVALTYKMIDLLLKCNDAYEAEVPPNQMGIHPKNRAGKKWLQKHCRGKGTRL